MEDEIVIPVIDLSALEGIVIDWKFPPETVLDLPPVFSGTPCRVE